jgi:branched-chain amino acid transport system substrate-binding protein
MALYAHQQHYANAALVFGNDSGGQSVSTAVQATYTRLGGKIVDNLKLALDQPDYRTEIAQLLATKPRPQVIFTETDPSTSSTFFSELKQLSGGIIPTICDEVMLLSPDHKALVEGVGKASVAASFQCVQNYSNPSSPSNAAFANSLKHVAGLSSSTISADTVDPYVADVYDSINIMALAMTEAKTTNTVKYNTFIENLVNPGPGKQVVSSYAQGVAALKAGHKIRYIGTVGANTFNHFHDSAGPYEIAVYNAAGQPQVAHIIPSSQIAQAPR